MWQEPAALRDFGAANDLLWVKGGEDSQGRSSPKCPDYSESDQLGDVATNVLACHEPL